MPFGYWEDIVVNDETWKAFSSTSALLLNGRCELVPFIVHMNHITNLQVKIDEYWRDCMMIKLERIAKLGVECSTARIRATLAAMCSTADKQQIFKVI